PLIEPVDPQQQHVLSFEYRSATGTDHLQIFTLPPGDEDHSVKETGLSITEGWSPHAIDLKLVLEKVRGNLKSLRLDFGSSAGKVIQIRSLQLRPPNEREQEVQSRR